MRILVALSPLVIVVTGLLPLALAQEVPSTWLGEPVHAEDPAGDVVMGPASDASASAAADILAVQVGPANDTYVQASLWLQELPAPTTPASQASYSVQADIDATGETVTWRATYNGQWGYGLGISGGRRTVAVQALGSVDEDARRIDIRVERYWFDPVAGDALSNVKAASDVGYSVLLSGCSLHACDAANAPGIFHFAQDTGTGLHATVSASYAPGQVRWDLAVRFAGPDATFASNQPDVFNLSVEVPEGWRATPSPAALRLQAGESANVTVSAAGPALNSTTEAWLTFREGGRSTRVHLPAPSQALEPANGSKPGPTSGLPGIPAAGHSGDQGAPTGASSSTTQSTPWVGPALLAMGLLGAARRRQ